MLKLVRLKEERDGGVGVHPSAGDEDHCSHPTVVSLCVCVCGGGGAWGDGRRCADTITGIPIMVG